MTPAFSMCIYCGSRSGANTRFVAVAREVGTWIGAHGGQLVYGGGHNGLMGEVADATLAAGGRVALPGGIGTFEELFEVWTWRQLGYHAKPMGLLDVDGYYQPLLQFLRASVQQGFMSDWQLALVKVVTDAPALLRSLVQDAGVTPPADLTQI